MGHYIDIRVRPDPEFPPSQLLAALYAKLHRALVGQALDRVGVAFPGYAEGPPTLGQTMRLLGPTDALDALMASDWLRGMHDHVAVAAMAPVPATSERRRLRRVQAKSSPERLRRRQMRRHGWTEDEAKTKLPDSAAKWLDLPFLSLASSSSGQRFRLFLRLEAVPHQEPVATRFNAYGLAQDGAIPWF